MTGERLYVVPLDRAPMHGTGGELVPLIMADRKGTAAKVMEEAAEAYAAWQAYSKATDKTDVSRTRGELADELADVITAAVDLARCCGIVLQDALDRCAMRNVARGRIDA